MKKHYPIAENEMTLYTRNAQYYIQGRVKSVLGLFQFNKILKQVNQYAARDNPYADWILWQLHDELQQARHQLQRLDKRYHAMLKTGENQRKLTKPKEPVTITLRGVPVYTFMVGDMLSDYDSVLSVILTAKFTGLALDKDYGVLEQNLKQIIDPVFNLPNRWKAIEVSRPDIQNNTKTAQDACELMGVVPKNILTGELRAPHAPVIQFKMG